MSRKPAKESIWTRREPGSRQPRLSRAKIAAAAVAIADQESFEAVSMRRVAEALEVSTMSLYYYVKTRDELTALMDDALMGEHLLREVKRGPNGLLELAMRTYGMLVRHPWALLSMRSIPPGPNTFRHAEQSLETLADTRLSAKAKVTLLATVDDLVFGAALRDSEARAELDPELVRSLVASGEFPELQHTHKNGRVEPDGRRLERALEVLIASALGRSSSARERA